MKPVKRLIVLLALAFILVLVPAVPAQPNKPIRCEMSGVYDWVKGQWNITITGDISGNLTIFTGALNFAGQSEHFFETWEIMDELGNLVLAGFDEGVVSFKNLKFRANGRVTEAYGELWYLIGCKMHASGTVSILDPGPPPVMHATGTMFILPSTGS